MRGHHTNIRTDSTRTTAYINRQQGLGYPHLCKMSAKLWQWTDPLFCTQSRTCAMIIQRQGRHITEKGPKSRRLDHICHLFRKAALLPKKKKKTNHRSNSGELFTCGTRTVGSARDRLWALLEPVLRRYVGSEDKCLLLAFAPVPGLETRPSLA